MNHSVTNTAALDLPARDLPVGPYTLGAWLGADHGLCQDREVALHIEAEGEACDAATIGRLRALGVLATRHIPAAYLRASADQRRALLAGLLDTAGTVAPTGHVQFLATDRALVRGVYELVVSLGYRCTMTAGSLDFSTVDDVFRVEGRRLEHKERRRAVSPERSGLRYVVAVRPTASVPVRCVSVDNPDHLYLAGRAMIPTHNSTAAMDFARSASVRHNMASAIFSLEMSKIEIVTRLLAAEARVPMHVLRSGQLSDDDWTRLARRMGEISEAPIYVDDTPNMTLMEIRAKARRMRQRNELKLVVVDYLQLMTSPKRVESRQQEVAELSRGLKLLAKEIECPVVAVSQLNRGPEQRTDKRPQLSDLRESGCLPALTRVTRADTNQETTIGALLASGETDVPVWALDGKLRYVPAIMTHAFPTGVRPVFRMRLGSGREVEATGNHRFLTIDGWTPLEQLAPGSRVAVPRHLPPPLAASPRSDEDVAELVHELDEASPGTGVPPEVFALPKRQIRLFLRAVWASHGWVSAQRGGRVSCTATSRVLLEGLRSLLLRFGISTRLRTVRSETDWPQYTLDVAGRDDQLRFLREIGVPGPRSEACVALLARLEQPANVDTVPDEVWSRVREVLTEHRAFSPLDAGRVRATPRPVPSPSRLAQVAAVLDSADLELHATNDVVWDEVESIEALGAQPVYDATVLGLHNFIADGVVVHNSIEQDADVVILLHRDDYYDKESPRAGEADFIVAKHRNGPTDTVTVAAQLHFSRFVDMAL
jgi:replicative DNA helicase